MVDEESKHRMHLALYDLKPRLNCNWVAPSATVIGEVVIGPFSSIWYNSVVRGDINRVDIGQFTSVGDNCVIHTAAALPTGMPAKVSIHNNVTIGAGSTIYSCEILDDVYIGEKCVIMEGAKLEAGC